MSVWQALLRISQVASHGWNPTGTLLLLIGIALGKCDLTLLKGNLFCIGTNTVTICMLKAMYI